MVTESVRQRDRRVEETKYAVKTLRRVADRMERNEGEAHERWLEFDDTSSAEAIGKLMGTIESAVYTLRNVANDLEDYTV